MNDLISRQAVLDYIDSMPSELTMDGRRMIRRIRLVEYIQDSLPSAEPKKGKWIHIKKRPMDDEERKEWSERLGYDVEYEDAYIYSNLPDDGEEVLVCYSWGNIRIDTFYSDCEGVYFEESGDMDDVVAWMPLPEPYKAERSEE